MWKKEDEQTTTPRRDPGVEAGSQRRGAPSKGGATIGPSIHIDGDVTGSEDLLIQGHVDGSVTLKDNAVSVGKEGRVHADIQGRVITIEGRVEGDLSAQEQIVLRGSAQVKGDIKAPRVVLEDGATFRGLVDMGAADSNRDSAKSGTASPEKASGRDGGSTAGSAAASSGDAGGSSKSSGSASASDAAGGSSTGKGSDATDGKKATQKAGA